MLGLEAGHLLLVCHKVIVAMHEHEPKEIPHELFFLHVEVPEHICTVPVANHLDDVVVDAQATQGHCTRGAEGAGGHVLGFES